METRQITQAHIYYLILNGVYDRCEYRKIALVADDKQKLIDFYFANLLPYNERYRDDTGIYRSFKQGVLYNYNPDMDEIFCKDEWVNLNEIDSIRHRFPWLD